MAAAPRVNVALTAFAGPLDPLRPVGARHRRLLALLVRDGPDVLDLAGGMLSTCGLRESDHQLVVATPPDPATAPPPQAPAADAAPR